LDLGGSSHEDTSPFMGVGLYAVRPLPPMALSGPPFLADGWDFALAAGWRSRE